MKRKTEESRIAYNQIASQYDTSREGQYTRFHIRELANTIDLRDGDVVLDVACGNGTLLHELSKKAKYVSKSGDVRVYSLKELEAIFRRSGFRTVQVYKKDRGVFLRAQKEPT